ncbi:glycosyltransferase [Natronomonas halophila]|uniref:glycosyltransferase family 2 protein n=1 Tax=Natronomonas halophila TaxID=2747817 RepID=UPI0015B534C3|nr:glycosyltransferase [Natronomonas halophila]QLD86492.1 glycosyltransferase [Natronomonas halophila]
MDLSVVVPTLNDRDELRRCLDALAAEDSTETIVVNGPSTDGTSGMVRDHEAADVLVEIDERNANVARNAGLDRSRGDAVAFVNPSLTVEPGWRAAAVETLADTDVATGPTHEELRAGVATDSVESRTIRGRSVTYFNGGNVAFDREAIEAIDGFDEYLDTGGARDAAHRLAAQDFGVAWSAEMCVSRETAADGGLAERDWTSRYRSLSYRLAKNYGFHPTVPYRTVRHAMADAYSTLRDVASGDAKPTSWFGNGRSVLVGSVDGYADGIRARYADRSTQRNPNGWSDRTDRAVAVYDNR